MNGVIWQVEDIYSKRGGVVLDRVGLVDRLEGVRELEKELRGLRVRLEIK